MLEEMIQAVMEKMIATRHPHLKLPAVVFAKVDSARKLAETFQAEEPVIPNEEDGGSYQGHFFNNW